MPKRKRKSAPQAISDNAFIDAYQTAANTALVAEKLGLSSRVVINRAARLRGRGVPLKHMPNPRRRLSPDYLQSLVDRAKKLAPKS